MRKAFDANVPKLRPRLKTAVSEEAPAPSGALPAAGEGGGNESAPANFAPEPALASAAPAPDAEPGLEASQPPAAAANPTPTESMPHTPAAEEPMIPLALSVGPGAANAGVADAVPVSSPRKEEARGERRPATEAEHTAAFAEAPDLQARRERLLQVKRKVEAAARPAPAMPTLPETPGRAGESALALVRDLEGQLQRARDVEVALRADLDQARAELGRGAAESRRTVERLAAVEQQVEEKRAVLQEMLGEMSALEEERDGAVGRAQALAALDEERQGILDGLSARAEQAEESRAEAEAELERLGAEFDERAADAARLRAALAQVTRERDDLARELAEARHELAELADARKALEQVHEALATARARLG